MKHWLSESMWQRMLLTLLKSDLATAQTQIVAAEAAITTEQTARADADGALAQDITTLSTVSINSFRQNNAPTEAQGRKVGSLWTDTDNGNVTTQWNGSAWAPLENQVALDAFSAVQTIQTSISNGDFALASDITTLEASITTVSGNVTDAQADADTALTQSAPTTIDARVQDKLVAQVGFCLINGAPDSNEDNETDCIAAGGTWLPLAALAEAVRGVEINTPSGTVKIQDRMITYDTASVNASNALTDAASAQSTADTAVSDASTAQTAANNAKTTADTGVTNASLAQTAANNADGKAVAAQQDVDTLDTNLRAEYTLKIEVDPNDPNNDDKKLIGGFGLTLENDNTLQAGFNVDRFWVGNLGDTYASANVPFVVDSNDGKVYIKDAVIRDAAITTAKIEEASIDTLRIQGGALSLNNHYKSTVARTWNDGVGWNTTPNSFFVLLPDIGVGHTETVSLVLDYTVAWFASRKSNAPVEVNIVPIRIEYRVALRTVLIYDAWQTDVAGYFNIDSQQIICHGVNTSAVKLSIPSYSIVQIRLRTDRNVVWTSESDTDNQLDYLTVFTQVLTTSTNYR